MVPRGGWRFSIGSGGECNIRSLCFIRQERQRESGMIVGNTSELLMSRWELMLAVAVAVWTVVWREMTVWIERQVKLCKRIYAGYMWYVWFQAVLNCRVGTGFFDFFSYQNLIAYVKFLLEANAVKRTWKRWWRGHVPDYPEDFEMIHLSYYERCVEFLGMLTGWMSWSCEVLASFLEKVIHELYRHSWEKLLAHEEGPDTRENESMPQDAENELSTDTIMLDRLHSKEWVNVQTTIPEDRSQPESEVIEESTVQDEEAEDDGVKIELPLKQNEDAPYYTGDYELL